MQTKMAPNNGVDTGMLITSADLNTFVAQRTLQAPHDRRFNYYNTHVLVLTFSDMVRHYSTTVLWQGPGTSRFCTGFYEIQNIGLFGCVP